MLRPSAKEVEPLDDYKLLLVFDSGERKLYDLKPRLEQAFFAPLKNESLFRTVHVNGITVEWSGEIDICPDDLYYGSTNLK